MTDGWRVPPGIQGAYAVGASADELDRQMRRAAYFSRALYEARMGADGLLRDAREQYASGRIGLPELEARITRALELERERNLT